MQNVLKFKNLKIGIQQNELARLKIKEGADCGALFCIINKKISLGRGEDNDVVLSDLKISRHHAFLENESSNWIIRAINSSNGIFLNSKVVYESKIYNGDLFALGQTVFEFEVLNNKNSLKSKKKKNPILILLIALGFVFLLFPNEDKKKSNIEKKNKNPEFLDLKSFLPNSDAKKEISFIFKDGLREYFSKNYSRARLQFETVLQISPGHLMATFYLENSILEIQNEVKLCLEQGKKSLHAGKLREAKGHFNRVMILLYKDQKNSAYIEAQENLDKIKKEILQENEI